MRLVKVSLGGQTVTLGKTTWEMGNVSVVVETGLAAQLSRDCLIRSPATVKPVMTTLSQRSLDRLLLLAM